MIKRENPIGKTMVNRFFLEKYEECEKIHKKRVLAPYSYSISPSSSLTMSHQISY